MKFIANFKHIFIISLPFILLLLLLYKVKETISHQPYLKDTEINYASSPLDFQNLLLSECHIVLKMLQIVEEKQIRSGSNELEIQNIKEYVEDFETAILKDLNIDLNQFLKLELDKFNPIIESGAQHPLKIYRTIKRILNLLPKMKNFKDLREIIEDLPKAPTQLDLETSVLNLLRLNQILKVPFAQFVEGKMGKSITACKLSSHHLAELGEVALKHKYYSQAVDAFSLTLEEYKKNPKRNPKLSKDYVLESLNTAIVEHDAAFKHGLSDGKIPVESGPLLFQNLLHSPTHPSFNNRSLMKTPINSCSGLEISSSRLLQGLKFSELCRGNYESRIYSETKRLKCYLSSKSDPLFILSPLKIEVHSEDPLVLQYHELFGETFMENCKSAVNGELRTSRTLIAAINNDNGETTTKTTRSVISSNRSSSNAWIQDFCDPKFSPVLHRIGRILGVHTKNIKVNENLQVAAYSPGAHFSPHVDAIFKPEILDYLNESVLSLGDRLLTFMIYLSDIEEGGGTAFPILNTVINPEKGSGLLWYNLFPDGRIDYRTLHGGCPTYFGIKWIANKWIRSNDQMFIRKCPSIKPPQGGSWSSELHI